MGTIHYFSANGDYRTEQAKNCPSLEEIRLFVGGYLEVVWVQFKGKHTAMFVNADGHGLALPFNARATEIYHEYDKHNPYPILGNAIVLENIKLK